MKLISLPPSADYVAVTGLLCDDIDVGMLSLVSWLIVPAGRLRASDNQRIYQIRGSWKGAVVYPHHLVAAARREGVQMVVDTMNKGVIPLKELLTPFKHRTKIVDGQNSNVTRGNIFLILVTATISDVAEPTRADIPETTAGVYSKAEIEMLQLSARLSKEQIQLPEGLEEKNAQPSTSVIDVLTRSIQSVSTENGDALLLEHKPDAPPPDFSGVFDTGKNKPSPEV